MGWLGEGVVWGCWEGEVYVTQQIEAHILPSVNKPRNMRCTVGWMKGCGTAWWSGRDFVISTVYLYILWTFWSKKGAMAPAPLATVLVLLSLITGAFFKVMRMKNVTWKIKSTFCRLQTSRDRSIMRLYRALAVSVRHLEFMRRYNITKISPHLEQTYLDGLLCRMSTLSWQQSYVARCEGDMDRWPISEAFRWVIWLVGPIMLICKSSKFCLLKLLE